MAFADHYPLTAYQSIADAAWWRAQDWSRGTDMQGEEYRNAAAADANDRKRVNEHMEIFDNAVLAHLEELRSSGRLNTAAGIGGRNIPIADCWNAFVEGNAKEWQIKWVLQMFHHMWTRNFVEMDSGRYKRRKEEDYVRGTHIAPSEDRIAESWENICSELDTGNSFHNGFPRWEIEANDQVTGDRCQMHFDNWQVVIMKRDQNFDLIPIEDIEEAEIVTASFMVPSGKLMLTDFLRIEGFEEGTDFGPEREYGELSLNTQNGREKLIEAYAAEQDIAYTQTTNTCVAIFSDEKGRLIVTERWNDEMPCDENEEIIIEGWTRLGDFSCDMWRVMAFDRNIALDRIREGGNENPEKALDAYLTSNDCYAGNVVQIEVEAGEWKIHSGENFSKLVDRKENNLPEDLHVWCLLEKA